MKKLILVLALLFQIINVLGQKNGTGKTEWTSWTPFPCFNNLFISMRSLGYVESINSYSYQFKLKNTSTSNIHFNIDVKINKTGEKLMVGRFSIESGKEYTHVSSYANAVPEPNSRSFFTSVVTGYMEKPKS